MTNNICCRACLGITPEMISIFEPYRSFTIAHILSSLTDIKITEDQYLPNRLCSRCLEELELVLNFQKKCIDTDKCLTSLSQLIPDEPCKLEVKEESDEIKVEEYSLQEVDTLECESDNYSLVDDGDMLDVDLKNQAKNSILESALREPTLNYYECHDCGERLRTKCKLRVHWKRTHKFTFTCEKCKRVFKAYQAYKRHCQKGCVNPTVVKIVVEGTKRRYFCRFCDYNSLCYSSLKVHSYRHTGERVYPCNICNKTFTQWSSLYDHKETAHQLYRVEITCDHCGKHIKGRNKCYEHLKSHLTTTFQCDICKIVLKTKQILTTHIKNHYLRKEKIAAACEICGKVFACYNVLQKHCRLTHFIKNNSCKLCKYQHKDIAVIRKHERQHFQENVLQCSLCFVFFDCQKKIDRHMRIDHGSKTHFCVFCKKGFTKRYTVLIHQQKKHIELLKGYSGPTYVRISAAQRSKNVVKAAENIQ